MQTIFPREEGIPTEINKRKRGKKHCCYVSFNYYGPVWE